MSTFAAMGVQARTDDWLIAGISLLISFVILYPVYIVILRARHSRRIKSHLVTSNYKLPIKLTPVELAYVFSTKVSNQQLYATLLDLTNRSVLVMGHSRGAKTVGMGPKLDNNLLPFEKMLVKYIHSAKTPVNVDMLKRGSAKFVLENGSEIQGSRQYVFWWLLRQSMRDKKLIEKSMSGKYSIMLVQFAFVAGLLVSTLSLLIFRLLQMLNDGEVELGLLLDSLINGLIFWVLCLVPLIIISFVLLRFRGKMLGRKWLLTKHSFHYLGQLDGYREFVRLVHRDELRFDSDKMKQESKAETRPYAIALGYVKE